MIQHAKQFLEVERDCIAYTTFGNPANPALMMVHGWLSHAGIWRQTIASFLHNHYCISIDLLGHGHSDKPHTGDYSISAQAQRVQAVAAELGLERYTLLGHSMGGMISLFTTLSRPESIEHLILVAPIVDGKLSPYVRSFLKPVYKIGMNAKVVWDVSRASLLRLDWYQRIFDGPFFYDRSQLTSDRMVDWEMATIEGIEVAAFKDLVAIEQTDLSEQVGQICCPTHVIFGQFDETVPIENGYFLREAIVDSELIIIQDCGHVPMVEKPIEYLDALRDILPR